MMRIPHLLCVLALALGSLYLLARRRGAVRSPLLLLPGIAVIVAMAMTVGSQTDDAYITYRYAENLASGKGPVYNPNERVEGYTNPLWMLLLAAGIVCGIPPTIMAPVLAGCLLLALLVQLDALLTVEGVESTWIRGLLPIALGISPAFVLWWFSGLEVPAYALLMVMACWQLSHAEPSRPKYCFGTGLAVALAVAVRPDALILVVVAVAWVAVNWGVRLDDRKTLTGVLLLLGPVVAVCAASLGFRLVYYGEWLPNTYYVKLGSPLLARLKNGSLWVTDQVAYAGGAIPLVLGTFATVWARTRRFAAVALATVLLHAAYFMYTGGDGIALGRRFFVHITPLWYVLAWIGVVAISRKLRPQAGHTRQSAFAAGLILLAVFVTTVRETPRYKQHREFGRDLHVMANTLADNVPRDFQIAIRAAGIVPYVTGMPTIDMLGLCDYHIAHSKPHLWRKVGHQKWDGNYVVSREPDIILRVVLYDHPTALQNKPRGRKGELFHQIRASSRFRANYKRVSVPVGGDRWLIFWGHTRRNWRELFPQALLTPVATETSP